ncbi:MAG: hypothetical protein U0942_15860 [Parvibaculum sp.]|uniref:hypothetical protein n=1 Tax=Parvibaculum sp. TaxID=2024848 RepID=UPI002AB83E9E|nr:hypothetical protein [Parvibaculum sp.]MDZ4382807.1 hypothetical protein [Parvibaculum sp.]
MSRRNSDMARVKFLRSFDWRPPERLNIVISFEGGKVYTVRRACAEAALAAGAGVHVTKNQRRGARRPDMQT